MFKSMIALSALIFSATSVFADPPKSLTPDFPTQKQIEMLTEGTPPTTPTKEEITTVPSKDRYIIVNDPGGSVSEFVDALLTAKKEKMKFKIDGYCASACTLILATPLNLDVCVTPKASFKFHQPFAMNAYGQVYATIPYVVKAQQLWNTLFYGNYPDWVKKTIDKNGGVPNVYKGAKTSDTFDINYAGMKAYIPTCA